VYAAIEMGDAATGPDEFQAVNRAMWNERAGINYRSAFYDVEGFRAGAVRPPAYEIEEVGDVAGKDLLHLQCHFGIDTLSWGRFGARVTGVDFSERAIAYARELSSELGEPATFVCCDVLDLPVRFPYFARETPLPFPVQGSYADPEAQVEQTVEYCWPHGIGEIVTALASAGLRIDFLHEWPFLFWSMPFLVEHPDRTWRLPAEMSGEIPLTFSLRATKA